MGSSPVRALTRPKLHIRQPGLSLNQGNGLTIFLRFAPFLQEYTSSLSNLSLSFILIISLAWRLRMAENNNGTVDFAIITIREDENKAF